MNKSKICILVLLLFIKAGHCADIKPIDKLLKDVRLAILVDRDLSGGEDHKYEEIYKAKKLEIDLNRGKFMALIRPMPMNFRYNKALVIEGINMRILWIRNGKVRYNGEFIELEAIVKALNRKDVNGVRHRKDASR